MESLFDIIMISYKFMNVKRKGLMKTSVSYVLILNVFGANRYTKILAITL